MCNKYLTDDYRGGFPFLSSYKTEFYLIGSISNKFHLLIVFAAQYCAH